MPAFNIRVMIYINGIRFDPISVSVGAADGAQLSFSVEVPGIPEWDALPERSHGVIFFSDPVSNAWRMMCEGEYIGYNKVKSAGGQRRRSLMFRGLHAMWDTIQRLTITGMSCPDLLRSIVANAQTVPTGTLAPPTTKLQTDYTAFLAGFKNSKAPLSVLIPALIDAMATQSPVDTFYHQARRLNEKTFAFADTKVSQLLKLDLMQLILNGVINETTQGKTLTALIADLENVAMYHHVPLLAPPLIDLKGAKGTGDTATIQSGYRIPEIVFIPQLYGAIPPACNVIFTDQIIDVSMSRNFLAEPTRVVTQVETGAVGGDTKLPAFIMVNNVDRAIITNKELNISSVTFINDRTSDVTMKAGLVATHDLITTEEYHRGVIPHFLSMPLENAKAVVENDKTAIPKGETLSGMEHDSMLKYIQAATRSHFETIRAGARSALVTCAFQPYVAVGFPCLIEDATGPFWGVVSAVTHTLSATGAPTTSLQISHVREAYAVTERLRNLPLASWICEKFYPDKIEDDAYAILFGKNVSTVSNVGPASVSSASSHAAMLPRELINQSVKSLMNAADVNDQSEYAASQVNLDELAGFVMNIPKYTADISRIEPPATSTIASNIHASPDPAMAALRYQFRPGLTLSQYAEFHALGGVQKTKDGAANDPDFAYGAAEPENLDTPSSTGHKLFGAPQRMTLKMNSGSEGNQDVYGPYELAQATTTFKTSSGSGLISPIRQNAAKMIKAAIANGITEG